MNKDTQSPPDGNRPVPTHPATAIYHDLANRLPQGVLIGIVIAAVIVAGVWILQT